MRFLGLRPAVLGLGSVIPGSRLPEHHAKKPWCSSVWTYSYICLDSATVFLDPSGLRYTTARFLELRSAVHHRQVPRPFGLAVPGLTILFGGADEFAYCWFQGGVAFHSVFNSLTGVHNSCVVPATEF